jgi:hypothetical protein
MNLSRFALCCAIGLLFCSTAAAVLVSPVSDPFPGPSPDDSSHAGDMPDFDAR